MAFLVVIIIVLVDLYITKPTTGTQSYNLNSTTTVNQYSNSQYQNLSSQLQEIQNNQRTPIVTNIYQNKQITLSSLNSSTQFYNSTYNLYNNYTVASMQNYTLNFKYNGYLIINIQNVSEQYSSVKPAVGTFGVQVYSLSLETYYSYVIPAVTCSYITGYGEYCPNNKAIALGWGLYPENYSASYLAPVGYGNVTISFTNSNNYPINIDFSVTYVGENYTNLIPITSNYSN